MMIDEKGLVNFIKHLKNQPLYNYSEIKIRQGVLFPILKFLHYDPFNVKEVEPEYSVSSCKVDFAIRVLNEKVFIETKAGNEDLEKHQEQLLKYAFSEGVPLAILTNGSDWWFYLPLKKGNWEERKFYSIKIKEQDAEDIKNRFRDFLSKEKIEKGHAIRNAEEFYNSTIKRHVIERTLPEAWEKIISENNEVLFNLVKDKTEIICGYRPEDTYIQTYFEQLKSKYLVNTLPDSPRKTRRKEIRLGAFSKPGNIPVALEQILEVVQQVRVNKCTRKKATNLVAQKRNIAPQTVLDKYCRQLGRSAVEFDNLMAESKLNDLKILLIKKFPNWESYINSYFYNMIGV